MSIQRKPNMNWIYQILLIWGVLIRLSSSQHVKKSCYYDEEDGYLDCLSVHLEYIQINKYPLNITNVNIINFGHIKPHDIQYKAFSKLTNLSVIFLHENALRRIDYELFANNTKLNWINLNNNRLTELDSRLFRNLEELEILELTGNKLVSLVDENLFSKLKQLRILRISNNGLLEIVQDVFKPLSSLRFLDLSKNALHCDCDLLELNSWAIDSSVSIDFVCNDPSINTSGSLDELNCTDVDLGNSTKSQYSNKLIVTLLNLNGFIAVSIPFWEYFPDFRNANMIILHSITSLTSLLPRYFSQSPNVWYLDLSSNFIKHIHPDTFLKLNKLKQLYLSNNKILSLGENRIFVSQTKLTILKVDNNNLSHLSREILEPLTALRSLEIDKNPYICDCGLRAVYLKYNRRGLNISANCKYNNSYTRLPLSILEDQNECDRSGLNFSLLILLICVACLFSISAMIILWLFCHKRKKIENNLPPEEYDDILPHEEYCYEMVGFNTTALHQLLPVSVLRELTSNIFNGRGKVVSSEYDDVGCAANIPNSVPSYCYVLPDNDFQHNIK